VIWQILGLVENMSCFKCPKCGENSYIFGEGGAQRTAEDMDMKFLGEVRNSSE
jgi:ATP-binding protein involved in chromosome partitioning